MEKKNDYLLNLVIASAAIATTLFLLNKWWNKRQNKLQPGTAAAGDAYNNTDMPGTGSRGANGGVQRVQIVEEEQCLFPNEIVQTFNTAPVNWGELNPNAPDFSQNINIP